MTRVKGEPANDNIPTANDNRAQYMRDYMQRRRRGRKTLKSLLKDGLQVAETHAPANDPAAKIFIAAVKQALGDKPAGRRKGART